MRINAVKRLWREGKPAVGGWLTIPHCFAAEMMAHSGLDWLCIDMQHGCKVVAGIHTASSRFTQRYLDQGFQMVMLVADRAAMSNYVKAELGRLTGWTQRSSAAVANN